MKRALPYLITTIVGAIVSVIVICVGRVWTIVETREIFGLLSNAFFVPGVLIAGVGLIIFASNGGAFYMLGYGMHMFVNKFRRDLSKRKYKDFYEYQEEKKKKKIKFGFLLAVGGAFIVLAVVMIIVYYCI